VTQEDIKEKIIEAIEADPNKDCIKSISLFGSFLHGDAKENSDVDLLVELRKRIGFFTLLGIQDNLAQKLGRKVDLLTKEDLSKYYRDEVVREAKKIYQYD